MLLLVMLLLSSPVWLLAFVHVDVVMLLHLVLSISMLSCAVLSGLVLSVLLRLSCLMSVVSFVSVL